MEVVKVKAGVTPPLEVPANPFADATDTAEVTPVTPLMLPPVMATVLAFCVDIVPKPLMLVLGIVRLAEAGFAPLPNI
jgi:hypothetical protein